MLLPCEVAIKYFIPAIRVRVTKELLKNLNQTEIASKLGITQAAVSQYLAGKYSEKIKKLENEKSIKLIAKTIASSIEKNQAASFQFSEALCRYCQTFIKKIICEVKRK